MARLWSVPVLLVALTSVALWSAAPAHASPRKLEPPPWASGDSAGEDLRVTLITFGPGSEVASLFGHSALLVEDTKRAVSRVYNYGMFSFDATLLVRYALGKLTFWLGEASLEGTLRVYTRQQREIVFRELLLSPDARASLAGFLAWNARPENRGYLYDHFFDNCATRPRDAIDRFGEGRLRQQMARPGRMSLREHVRRYTGEQPVVALLFDFLMNSDVERPITVWDEAFLPAELAREVDAAGLAAAPRVVAEAVGRPAIAVEPPRWAGLLFVLGTGLGALGLLLARGACRRPALRRLFGLHQVFLGLALGVPGMVLALMWAITEHRVAYANENLLLANPLTLLVAPLGLWLLVRDRELPHRLLEVVWLSLALTGAAALLAKGLPLFEQDNGPLLAFFVPLNGLCALAAATLRRRRGPPGG